MVEMTTLTYIPNRKAYGTDEWNWITVDCIINSYMPFLAYYLDCSLENVEDIQNTLAHDLPDRIYIVDDSVYYLYKEETF